MVITIIIGLLLAFVTGFFCAVKSVQLGLKWQIQTANKQEPILNTPSMPTKQVDPIDIGKYSKEQMSEWMFGKEGSG